MPFGSHSLREGEEAPLLILSTESNASHINTLKGKYVVINFWSIKDPDSRIKNRRLADLTSTLPSSQICFVSICTDNDTTLKREIIETDGYPENTLSFSASDFAPEVLDDYQTNTGCRSFLIDPFGNLKKINPDENEITEVLV